ncbi:hypothetical protein HN51_006796 [Arachis hypogaea]|nr:Putative ribonuclease H protein [Arachis hypogaea]
MLMWRLAHGRILTAGRRTWMQLIQLNATAIFFGIDMANWIRMNLENNLGVSSVHSWIDEFFVTCWAMWKWRNQEVFSPPFNRPTNAVKVIRGTIENYTVAQGKRKASRNDIPPNRDRGVWHPPAQGWLKLNTDGAFGETQNDSGSGGLLRTH